MADESGSNPNPAKGQLSSSPSPSSTRERGQLLNLLLVEDNLPDALIIKGAIKKENLPVTVHIVADGERAIEFITAAEQDENAPFPHVLLLDLNLPKVDGFEVLRSIRSSEKFKDLPVLVVTSSDSPTDRSEVAKLGASYFRKPVTYTEFMKIGVLLHLFLQENRLI
jgi:CheY-like chemotaxis protein